MTRSRTALPLALALTALLLAGCSSGGTSGGSDASASSEGAAAGGVVAGDTGGAVPVADTAVDLRAVPGAAVVRTADLSVRVDDVAAAADEARRLVRAAGGEAEAEDRSGGYASLRLRVPPAELDRTVTALAALGEETGRRLGSEDVTEQVVDLQARLATQRASVERVRALLAEATALGEVVQVEAELTRRTADLEALEARSAALDAQVDLATVTLSLEQRSAGGVAGAALGPLDGLQGGWEALLTAGRLLGVAGGAVLPFLPLVLGAALLVRRLRRPGPVAG